MNRVIRVSSAWCCVMAVGMAMWLAPQLGHSQIVQQAVGGVSIDADGVVNAPTVEDQEHLAAMRESALDAVPEDLEAFTELRAVSLRQIENQVAEHLENGTPLPEAVKYLAGLQRVQYVFVYPEQNDVVLAGPAEGWRLDSLGNVVGRTTGRPVLLLDDLAVALRTRDTVQLEAISCSIDPTPEGMQRLQALNRRLRTMGDPESTLHQMEEALGPQVVSVTGVPRTSHFARTMVAADFRMKRIAMNFQPAPIDGLPSYLHLVAEGRGAISRTPRWWLAPMYEPIARDADGLAWELRGQGVQCMTEEDHFDASGERVQSAKANPMATRWAKQLTERFTELADHDSAFGQLRNAMDLAVIAALLDNEQLLDRVNLQLTSLVERQPVAEYHPPSRVASQASFLKRRGDYVISVSGGVELLPWEIVERTEQVDAVAEVRTQVAVPKADKWYW